MGNNIIINNNCWVACCDILGFTKTVKGFEKRAGVGRLNIFVNNYYNKIIGEFERRKERYQNDVFSIWFSDTFLFFTRDDSEDAFKYIRSTFDIFYWMVISMKWPLRGAIGFGQLYADISKNLFLGSGVINAYEYAEKQNWIGYIVTPEANNRLDELDVNLSEWRVAFTRYPVPFHKKKEEKDYTLELFVSKIHHNRNEVIRAVKAMQQEAMKDENYQEKYKIKYENTLKFFDRYP
ncbi:MAG: hypothetical protein DRP62_04190 [Planctomycetota bacterium]|nr:MAG: hypothetical protein DRP62_04190 [Planctomycetota bacterium]